MAIGAPQRTDAGEGRGGEGRGGEGRGGEGGREGVREGGRGGMTVIYIIIRDCTRVGAAPRAFCVPNSVALASLTLQVVYWAIH